MKKEDFIYASSICCTKWINGFKNPKNVQIARILVVKLDEIGDMVNALPVFQEFKIAYPKASLTLWCKPFVKTLLEPMSTIDQIVTESKSLNGNYDLIVELRGNYESIKYAFLHPPKYRLDRATIRLRNKLKHASHPHEVITNLQIIEPIINTLPSKPLIALDFKDSDIVLADQFLTQNNIKQFAVFHCGARRKLRQWKESNFIAVAKYLNQHYQLQIIFAGDESDLEMIARMQKSLDFTSFSVAGKFSLSTFAALCKRARIFLGNESGPLHVAAASGSAVLGLYGPGEPHVFYPWGPKGHYLHEVLSCNPCDQIHCKFPENTCMDRISIAAVQSKLDSILAV